MVTLGKLTPELYWEWRCSAAEFTLAKQNLVEQELKLQLHGKDLEIQRLRMLQFKNEVDAFKGKAEIAKKEYDHTKDKIEAFLGRPMVEGCIINESLEVIQLEDKK